MLRRSLLATVCVALAAGLGLVCTFTIFNFMRLAQAQVFVRDFVREAIDRGSTMPLPELAPSARPTSRQALVTVLDRARRIGPFVEMQASSCAVQADVTNVCGGQLLACIVTGQGRQGQFQADIAMCRRGNFAPYQLADSVWTFAFMNGEPAEADDRSPI